MMFTRAFSRTSIGIICSGFDILRLQDVRLIVVALLVVLVTSCRDEKEILTPEHVILSPSDSAVSALGLSGFYLLNEGNMGSNKATLDYYDFATGTYNRNIYAMANPSVAQELGDVGNDLKIYGSKLYAVINCSNLIEVMDARTARHIGSITVPNGRYMAFADGYAYVTSYAGPVSIKPDYEQIGYVAKIDTATLQIIDTCYVGFQPDEIEVVGGCLYVANSGGYMTPNYDTTISVIDIASFSEIKRIDVAPNLHRLRLDGHRQLWVSSRGDYKSVPPRLFCINVDDDSVVEQYDLSVSDFDIAGDSLFVISSSSESDNKYMIIDVCSHAIVNDCFINADSPIIQKPYSVKANYVNGDIYVTDAKDYVSPGVLYCFDRHGIMKWSVSTGDIPAHIAFVADVSHESSSPIGGQEGNSPYIAAVDEYVPAPGQFVNILPRYENGDSEADMLRKCNESLANNAGAAVTLGAYGGYVTFHFNHPVKNLPGTSDFAVYGNAITGGSEAGIVMVSIDVNHNGIPDDEWYELKGSASEVVNGYSITYYPNSMIDIPWTDNMGNQGFVFRNEYHKQEYYPKWISSPLTFSGSLLPSNAHTKDDDETYWMLDSFDWGYVDNKPNDDVSANSFDISNAVDSNGSPASVDHADFIRVYTALNQHAGWLGETSTEITGAVDLHPNL